MRCSVLYSRFVSRVEVDHVHSDGDGDVAQLRVGREAELRRLRPAHVRQAEVDVVLASPGPELRKQSFRLIQTRLFPPPRNLSKTLKNDFCHIDGKNNLSVMPWKQHCNYSFGYSSWKSEDVSVCAMVQWCKYPWEYTPKFGHTMNLHLLILAPFIPARHQNRTLGSSLPFCPTSLDATR